MAYSKAYIEGFRKAAEDASVDPDLLMKAAGLPGILVAGFNAAKAAIPAVVSRVGSWLKPAVSAVKKIPGAGAVGRGVRAAGSRLAKVKPRTWAGLGMDFAGSALGTGIASYMVGKAGKPGEGQGADSNQMYMSPDYLHGFRTADELPALFGRYSLQMSNHPPGTPSNFVPYIPSWQKKLMQQGNG